MIKKALFILLSLSVYVYLVSSDKEEKIISKIKSLYMFCTNTIENMDLEVHINKWPVKEEEEFDFF